VNSIKLLWIIDNPGYIHPWVTKRAKYKVKKEKHTSMISEKA